MSEHLHNHVCEGRLMSAPKVAVIGLGLMGASFAAALKRNEAAGSITGYDIDAGARSFCLEAGYINTAATNPSEAARNADIIVLAVPVPALAESIKIIAPALQEGAVVTDLASVKQDAEAQVLPHMPAHAVFCPAHPIAGKSESGARYAQDDLFDGKLAIITPIPGHTVDRAVAAVSRLWEKVGARVERMSPANHDIIYAYVSHLPQLMAYAACKALSGEPLPDALPDTFRRFTRLGGSDPTLWSGIVMANREPVRLALGHTLATLDHMLEELSEGFKQGAPSHDTPDAAIRFFPMLATAALISVVTQFEMQNNLRLSPYAGSGFRDFTAPAHADPNEDMAAISECYAQVVRYLERFRNTLHTLHTLLGDTSTASRDTLQDVLASCRTLARV